MAHAGPSSDELLFFGTLYARSPRTPANRAREDGQNTSNSSSEDHNSSSAIIRFKPSIHPTSFQVIPNKNRAFPHIEGDERYGETSPDVFGLQLTVHYVVSPSNSTKSRSFDVDVHVAEGAKPSKWDLKMDQDTLAHVMILRGQFDSVTLAIYGHPHPTEPVSSIIEPPVLSIEAPDLSSIDPPVPTLKHGASIVEPPVSVNKFHSVEPETDSKMKIHPNPLEQINIGNTKDVDPTYDIEFLLAKEFIRIGSPSTPKQNMTDQDQNAFLDSCVDRLFNPIPVPSSFSAQDLLAVGDLTVVSSTDSQNLTEFKNEIVELARSCFDHDNQSSSHTSNSIQRFVEGLLVLCDQIISRDVSRPSRE
ncbi:hypothetical protein CROQUDRAFT_89268 [Cronartium quercuum f. sp. fusiforme G11]|uniref:Virilizer N-terminal domain-containing protein n=1 Tax=Cronartium quercuum f. sp. fusiforme G11 TaxID=708437 RepID=A0A9P6NPS4_9BASI|nr:hypothetical protein CROQUDRAFT_89268 [Cronartium quercuum f. sp. fusiforme G11]